MLLEIDQALDDLNAIAAERDAVIYEIVFRKAGVAICWHEGPRAETHQAEIQVVEAALDSACCVHRRNALLGDLSRLRMASTESGQVVYRYYPSLSEAMAGERERLLRS